MGMLCIFVGNVLKFFRKGDTRKEKVKLFIVISMSVLLEQVKALLYKQTLQENTQI